MTMPHAGMTDAPTAEDRWAQPSNLPSTLPAMIEQAAMAYPQRDAIIDGTVRIDYASLWQQSQAVAAALISMGVEAGDRVAIWAPNISEWILAACGIHAAGAVMVPLNTRMKGPEAVDILDRSQAKILFCIGNFLGQYYPKMLEGIRPKTLLHVVVLREGFATNNTSSQDLDWRHFLQKSTAESLLKVADRIAQLTENSTADLMFTSGTTGRPKGVMAAHGPTIKAFSAWGRVVGLQQRRPLPCCESFLSLFWLQSRLGSGLHSRCDSLPRASVRSRGRTDAHCCKKKLASCQARRLCSSACWRILS
jgi:HIP---CoA ligase